MSGLLRSRGMAFAAGVASVAMAACSGDDRPTVVVYTSHDLLFSEPVLAEFEAEHGVDVQFVGDTEAAKTTGLVNRLLRFADRGEADVFWNNEVVGTVRLAERGLLATYRPPTAEEVPARFRDAADRWVGFGARSRVLLVHPERLGDRPVPRSIFDLTDPVYRGDVVIANPLFGTTSTHLCALWAVLGPQRTRDWLDGLRSADVRVTAGNAVARDLVARGEFAICLTDTDDANGALRRGAPVTMIHPDQYGLGTLVIPNTVMVLEAAPRPVLARKLVDYLASSEVEARLATMSSAQMPVRPGVAPHGPQFTLEGLHVMDVDWDDVARTSEACLTYVRESFLE